MRDETLRRLDEIIATAASVIAGADCGRQAIEDDWPVLRAELLAERCENCQHYIALCGWRPSCGLNEIWGNAPDFSCSHFTKKDAPP
jgi:hypothetical protein